MRSQFRIFSWIQLVIFFLSLFFDNYGPLTFTLLICIILMILDNLGKGIVLREIIALHTVFICLVMPLVGYTYFTRANAMARLWIRYMPIPEEQYFNFALPAIAGFVVVLCWPLSDPRHTDYGESLQKVLRRARDIVPQKAVLGTVMVGIGMVSFEAADYVPDALRFFFLLFFFAGFAGLLYVYYSPAYRLRKIVIGVFALFILVAALNSGMFTIVAYMGLTLFSFFFLGRKAKLWKKVSLFAIGGFLLVVIQMVKPDYRKQIWNGGYQGNKAVLFGTMFADKLTNFKVESADVFFPLYYRTNQGFNVSLVMRRFPARHDFDYGSKIAVDVASALVPRFLWPDKPEAGGKFNMRYYAGFVISGWSTNVGPLGEAYGSFGPVGGVVYMMFLALFIRVAYSYVFKVAAKTPLLLFWIPVFFYQVTYSAETDTLQILNSILKSAFFVWLLFKIKPDLFKIMEEQSWKRPYGRSLGARRDAKVTGHH
jgi:hypothetical protein